MNRVTHDTNSRKFFLIEEDQEASLSYSEIGSEIWNLTHTFVPARLRGKGLAEVLTRAALETAKAEGKKIVPSCSYVESFLKRKGKEYSDLVAHP
ncbi:N-acetyltransferase [Leptospira fletcheri]|uniref:N-acetyltransferase n=1 Tax=Leptospira fletcheri TaxID=2484981 RepID=A0A4R9G5M8_9LEPT|nr:GNAT family N-acetyltransferase [Leptospira fletcheri]TGK06465.1 N-acetyltransferase [Leptospira fletcheri]